MHVDVSDEVPGKVLASKATVLSSGQSSSSASCKLIVFDKGRLGKKVVVHCGSTNNIKARLINVTRCSDVSVARAANLDQATF
jgi:hypothetical protein